VSLSDLDAGVTRLYDTGRFREVKYLLDDVEAKDVSAATPLPETSHATRPPDARILRLTVAEERFARLGFGYRYDSRYKAALLASAVAFDVLRYGTRVEADVRLGEQGLAEGRLTRRVGNTPEFLIGVEAGYRRMPFDIYSEGLRVGTPRAYVTNLSLGAGLAIGNAAVLGVRVKGEHAALDEFAAVGEPFTGESRSYATVAALFTLDTYDRAVFPRTGARALLKSEYRFAGDDGSFAHSVLDAEGAVPLLDRLSLLGRLTVGTSTVDIPDHYHFFLGGTNSYFIFPDRQFPLPGLKALERHGRHLQSLHLGMQYEFHRYVVGRFRWSAGAALAEWDVDLDLLTYGFDLTLAALTRFGNAAVSLAGLNFASLPRLVIDVGFPF
jgi:outer membrane protein assembly factor BamA